MTVLTRYKAGWPIISMVGGVLTGFLLVSIYGRFSNTYATFITAAILGPFVLMIAGNTKLLLLGVLTACLPITIDVTIGHTGHLSGAAGYVISVFDIVLTVLYLLWIVEMSKEKQFYIQFFPQVSVPTFLLIFIAMISMAYARFPELSKYELIEMIKIYLAFFYIANNIRNERELNYLVAFLVAGLFLEGVIGFLQHRYSEPFWPTSLGGPRWIDNRVAGTWVSFNDFAWYLTFLLPLALSLLFSRIRPIYKYACGMALVLGCGSMMWTNSRGGWLSLAIAGIFVMTFAFGKIRGRWGLVKTVLSIMMITVLMSPIYPRMYQKLYGRFLGRDGGSAESRLPQYKIAYNIFSHNPFTGVGLNNYTAVMKDYDDTEEGLEEITPHAVHNIFLHIAAEQGVFGIFTFLWLIGAIFNEGIRKGAKNDGFVSYVNIGVLGGIIAFLFHGLVDTASLGSKLFTFFWFFAGIIFSSRNIRSIPGRIPI